MYPILISEKFKDDLPLLKRENAKLPSKVLGFNTQYPGNSF